MTPRYKIVDVLLSRSIDGPAEIRVRDTRGEDHGFYRVNREQAAALMQRMLDVDGAETPYLEHLIPCATILQPTEAYGMVVTWVPTEATK